ncbi:MAG: M36 family metallopeptidase [Acidobacteria bacterium]|nr:M36 family metallopeptidase [Acidobacteriota bacterium]
MPAAAQHQRESDPRDTKELPDFDARQSRGPATAALTVEGASSAEARLQAMRDGEGRAVRYTLDGLGRAKTLSSASGLTEPSEADAEVIARRFLSANDGVSPYAAAQLRLRQRTRAGALEVLRFQQYAGDYPVYEAAARVAVDELGRVRLATFDSPAPGVRLAQSLPRLSAEQAVASVLLSLGVEAPETLERLAPSGTRLLFAHPEGGMPIGAELVAFAMPSGEATLAWRIFTEAGNGSYEVVTSAQDGRLLLRRSVASELGSGRVFRVNPLQPSEILEFGEGWLAPETAVTMGNNIDAYVDFDGDDEPDTDPVEGLQNGRAFSPSQVFDFDPGTGDDAGPRHQPASVVNAFYHSNRAHDLFYDLGFGEAEGNFQVDNGDRGGLGNDPVHVEVQDIEVFGNARFLARPDGMASRVELGLELTREGTIRDWAYEGPVVIHEYTHGVTLRSVGGPDVVSCLSSVQPGALGEGWSDYFGASFTGATVLYDYISGDYVNGLRGAAINNNPRTYADLGVPYFQVHADGTIWASLLWDIRTALGAEAADLLIYRALALTTCSPTFVDARDAILAADGGEHEMELWTIFAARGLGFAASGSNFNSAGRTVFNANFDLPPSLNAGNRSPQVTSRPSEPATFGQPYTYTVRSVDLDGDARSYALLSGPAGSHIDATTGVLTWDSPSFTSARFQVEVTDGKGGRTVHGFLLYVFTFLSDNAPVVISGESRSTGYAYFDVPEGAEVFQLRLRGDSGEADVYMYSPDDVAEFSYSTGSNETLTIRQPQAGEWAIYVVGNTGYENVVMTADTTPPAELAAPGSVQGLAEAETGELFFKVTVPEGTPLLRATLTGAGDPDLLLAKGRIPLCPYGIVSIDCDEDESSALDGPYETISLENPEPGDYYFTVYGYLPFENVELRVSFSAPSAQPGAATDGAAFETFSAPGGIASLFGEGLANMTASATSLPLPTELGGVRVLVDGLECALFFVSPGQINFQFPARVSPGSFADLFVIKDGELSDPIFVRYRAAAPQVFVDPTTMLPVVTHADGSLVTPENPVRGGEAIVAYFTGIGFVSNMPADGNVATGDPLSQTLYRAAATLGGAETTVLFAGLTPGFVGLAQANLLLPAELPAGATLELALRIETSVTAYAAKVVSLPAAP